MSKKTDRSGYERYEIGKIAAAHGIKGDMILVPHTDFPERFFDMKTLTLSFPGKEPFERQVQRLVPYEGKDSFFLHLRGTDDRNAAEALKGAVVTVAADERVELEEDEYWLDDIIGIDVQNEAGETLGTVIDVLATGAGDVYVLKCTDGKERAIPARTEVVLDVNVEQCTMTVRIPEGLWD